MLDGQTNQGWIDGAAGSFTVSGDHVYLHPGTFPVQVTLTDPSGGTATSTSTASVTAAPLTATGGCTEDAVAGGSSTLTVATFGDANTYDAANSYTAVISWGDGTTSSGAIDGTDGVFRVTGGHAYASDGTYAVGVTITDADGTTATANSSVVVGDVLAGIQSGLTVSSFGDNDPNATASSFSASISWGDGGYSTGKVTALGGVFVVTGSHAYWATGSYQVQVTVWDMMEHSIQNTTTVEVVPGAAVGTGASLAATVGQSMDMGTPLAEFVGSGAVTAVVNWGDGSTSSAYATQSGGLSDVSASHVYATAGVFGVQTLAYNAAGTLIGAAVSMVAADGPTKVDGPTAVPGNSEYEYFFHITPTPADQINAIPTFKGADHFEVSLPHHDQQGDVDGWDVVATFANKPLATTLSMSNYLANQPNAPAVTLPVDVVQVVVQDVVVQGADKSFVKNESFKDKNANGSGYMGALPSGADPNPSINPPQEATVQPINSSPNGPVLTWQAQVTLVGPSRNGMKDQGVKDIQVGFTQEATVLEMGSAFGKTFVGSSLTGAKYLDVVDGQENTSPWYDHRLAPPNKAPATYLDGSLYQVNIGAGKPALIGDSDRPAYFAVTVYDKNMKVADSINWRWAFILSVAAATKQTGYEKELWRQAYVVWTWDASGDVAQAVKDKDGNILTTWTPNNNAGVFVPAKWNVTTHPVPTIPYTPVQLFNDALQKQTYKTK